jgi:hypothetical protein
MHVILEGIFPLELNLMLTIHVGEKVLYRLCELNAFLSTFPYIKSDKGDVPNVIPADFNVRSSQTAAQTLVLMRHLPLFVSTKVPADDLHWRCLLKLIQIMQITMSPLVNEKSKAQLTQLIESHNESFMELYPNSFIPKLHFMAHFPQQLELFGPLRNQTCFAFEMKHQIVKNIRWFNFKNLPFSVIQHLNKCFIASLYDQGGQPKTSVFCATDELQFANSPSANDDVLCSAMKLGGVEYNCGDILMDDNLEFFQIHSLVVRRGEKLIVANCLNRLLFDEDSNSFFVFITESLTLLRPQDLHYPWPTTIYARDGAIQVIPKTLPFFPHLD